MSSDQFFAQKWSNTIGQFNMLSFGSKNPGIVLQGTPKIFADLKSVVLHSYIAKTKNRAGDAFL